VKDEWAGKKGKCPGCGRAVQVPQALAAAGKAPVDEPIEDTQELPRLPALAVAELDEETIAATPPSGEEDGEGSERPQRRAEWQAGVVPADFAKVLSPPQEPQELGRLGSYRILQVLGVGGMGVVFKAEDVQLRRIVALKVMKPELAADELARQRFLREAQSAAALEHDHIITIHQVGQDRGLPFLAMQFLKGEPLNQCLKRERRLPLAEAVRIGREIAEGLAEAHAHGLIHRDIKPDNVFLVSGGESAKDRVRSPRSSQHRPKVKILDFGLARPVEEQKHLTQQGAIIGTPMYMAPEQASGQELDARCDLFSLGCVLYRMTTGRQAFQGRDTMTTLMAVATKQPVAPAEVDEAIPSALSNLVMKMLAKKPGQRPRTAAVVVEALAAIERALPAQDAASDEGPQGGRAPVVVEEGVDEEEDDEDREGADDDSGEWTGRQTRSRRGLAIALATVGALVVVVGVVAVIAKFLPRPGTTTQGTAPATSVVAAVPSTQPTGTAPAPHVQAKEPNRAAAERALTVGAWIRIVLPDGNTMNLNKLDALPQQNFQVESVNFSDNPQVNDEELQYLQGLPSLKGLGLGGTAVSNSGLEYLKGQTQLQTLLLNHTGISDAGLDRLKGLSNLLSLDLRNTYATEEGIQGLKAALPKCNIAWEPPVDVVHRKAAEAVLKLGGKVGVVPLGDNMVVEVDGIGRLPSLPFNLDWVDFSGIARCRDEQLKALEKVTGLHQLILDRTGVTDAGLVSVKQLKALTTLSLVATDIRGEGLQNLGELGQLTVLNLDSTAVRDAALAPLRKLSALQTLSLANTRVTDAALDNIRSLTNMKRLDLTGTQVSDAGLENLDRLTGLQELQLKGTKVSNAGLDHVKNLRDMQVLNLAGTRVGDDGLAKLRGLKLTTLVLDRTAVTDAGMAHVRGHRTLQVLLLEGTNISDAAMAALKEIVQLTELSLAGTKVTYAGLLQLEGLTGLRVLNIKGIKMSEVEYFDLKDKLMGCEISR
jgi:serine/threonine protein kinase/Leucine-rich repeat (LRR) protein